MQRPNEYDSSLTRLAAKDLLEDLRKAFPDESFDEEDSIYSLSEAIRYDDDGYAICRNLENDGWDCDSQMVEIMDNASGYKYRHHKEQVREWVKQSNPALLPVGTAVTFERRGQSHQGVISKVNGDLAEYTVYVEAMGHVREGIGTHGCVLRSEDCKPA